MPPFVTWPWMHFTEHGQNRQRTMQRVLEMSFRKLRKQRREEFVVMLSCFKVMGVLG